MVPEESVTENVSGHHIGEGIWIVPRVPVTKTSLGRAQSIAQVIEACRPDPKSRMAVVCKSAPSSEKCVIARIC